PARRHRSFLRSGGARQLCVQQAAPALSRQRRGRAGGLLSGARRVRSTRRLCERGALVLDLSAGAAERQVRSRGARQVDGGALSLGGWGRRSSQRSALSCDVSGGASRGACAKVGFGKKSLSGFPSAAVEQRTTICRRLG